MEFKYIAIFICLLLLAFLIFKEVSRPNKARLIWRILTSIIAVTCFILLLIPVKYNRYVEQDTNEVILLTEGTVPDSVTTLKGVKYVLASANLQHAKATVIPDLQYFLTSNPNLKQLEIYGYGLSDEELKHLKDYHISFHPSPKPSGIVAANWQKKLKTGEQLYVQGTFQNTGAKAVKLVLKGLGNTIDSVTIATQSNKSFSFKTRPKQNGKAVFQLIALQQSDTLSKNPVPFQVGDEAPMKVLILAAFPDFEYKFLKKWLYENQYPLAFRSQISKNKLSSDFLNMDSLNLNHITTPALKKFDVLIIDEEELAAISVEERAAIENAVANGMGILIRIASPKSTTKIGGKFTRYEAPAAKDKQLHILLSEENVKAAPLPLEQTLFLKAGTNDESVIADASGKILAGRTIIGYGNVVISSIPATYNWLLSGKQHDYASYWSTLLSKAARKKNETESVSILPRFPVANQKTSIVADLAESGKVPLLKADRIKLSPRQNIELPFQWDGIYWPKQAGWNAIQVNQFTSSIYIYQKKDWETLHQQQKLDATQAFVKTNQDNVKSSINKISIAETISLWWFFTGFLLSIAFLWFESRILGAK